MPKAKRFNQYVQVDVNHFKGQQLLHIIDLATKFHLACRIEGAGTLEVFKGLRDTWFKRAGPREVWRLIRLKAL